ncbi:hypothetical protein V8G54_014699 [Vigna mungo]|uniref:Uncharacterized protein n=1 Tax=Vigna mungo TaxID=3915 RepID=A0AAQ3NH57_VIGMU
MRLKVDLQCHKCYKKVKKILCKFPQIRDQVYDEKHDIVTITVVCCNPEKLRDKICCKGCGTIKSIEIVEPPKPKPPEKPKPEKPNEPVKPEKPKPEKPKPPPPTKPNPPSPEPVPEKPKPPPPTKPNPPRPEPVPPPRPEPVPPPCLDPVAPPTPLPVRPPCLGPVAPPTPLPVPCPLPIGVCCVPCCEGHGGRPCFHGHSGAMNISVKITPLPAQSCDRHLHDNLLFIHRFCDLCCAAHAYAIIDPRNNNLLCLL